VNPSQYYIISYQLITPGAVVTSLEGDVDPAKLEQTMQQLRSEQNLVMGVLGGFLAAIVAAVLWGLITYVTSFQIGFMAIGVGILVGLGVKYFGSGLTPVYGVVGAVLALFGCVLGNIMASVIGAARAEGSSFGLVFATLASSPSIFGEILVETFSPIDLLFYGIAIYEAYQFSIRRLTDEDLASIRRTPVESGQ